MLEVSLPECRPFRIDVHQSGELRTSYNGKLRGGGKSDLIRRDEMSLECICGAGSQPVDSVRAPWSYSRVRHL